MRAYIITTSVIFGLLTLAHVWRGFVEPNLVREPWFILITLITFVLCLWALRLLKRSSGS